VRRRLFLIELLDLHRSIRELRNETKLTAGGLHHLAQSADQHVSPLLQP
jgi:hypothetical protein